MLHTLCTEHNHKFSSKKSFIKNEQIFVVKLSDLSKWNFMSLWISYILDWLYARFRIKQALACNLSASCAFFTSSIHKSDSLGARFWMTSMTKPSKNFRLSSIYRFFERLWNSNIPKVAKSNIFFSYHLKDDVLYSSSHIYRFRFYKNTTKTYFSMQHFSI